LKSQELEVNDLAARCREILEWNATGLLHGGEGGALRAYAETLTDIPENYRLTLAQKKTEDEAMRFVVERATAA
jgi:hypothetical protein